MKNHDPLGSSQLRHGPLQLQCLVDGGLNVSLDFGLAETSLGFGGAATIDSVVRGAAESIFFSSVNIKPLARLPGSSSRAVSAFALPSLSV